MIVGARGVGPGLIESCGHVDPVEPSFELLNGGYTADRECLATPSSSLMEIILQWW